MRSLHMKLYQENVCLKAEENNSLLDMLYKHRDEFSLKDETSTCPNI